MSIILNQREAEVTRYVPCSQISSIIHQPKKVSEWIKVATRIARASCIACSEPRCLKYDEKELTATDPRIAAFPIDFSNQVCATGAIRWERGKAHPTINANTCILCGVCAVRCPVGAISLYPDAAKIHFDTNSLTEVTAAEQKETLSHLGGAYHAGYIHDPSVYNLEHAYTKIEAINTDSKFPNLITRNLLLAMGQKAMIRRRGDVYLRIDSIAEFPDKIAVFEIEFHSDSLESPRAILDDIAVLSSRYGIPKEQIRPFIVSYEFPNIRTEYWRVIKDIKRILNIPVESLSLGTMLILVWLLVREPLTLEYYADIDKPTISKALECETDAEGFPQYTRAILAPNK